MTYSKYFPAIEEASNKHLMSIGLVSETKESLFTLFSSCFDTADIGKLLESLRKFFRNTIASEQNAVTIEDLESSCALAECPINHVFSFIAEEAVIQGKGPLFVELCEEVARESQNGLYWFLCAWTSLNLDQLETCIEFCDKIKFPYSPVLSLRGQALLELARVEEAIGSLEDAVQADPKDLLSWFFLSKAYYVASDELNAWHAIDQCQKIEPQNPEVVSLMGIIASNSKNPPESWLEKSWANLYRFSAESLNGSLLAMLYRIAFKLGDRKKIQRLNELENIEEAQKEPDFVKNLAGILRLFQEKGWDSENRAFLERLG